MIKALLAEDETMLAEILKENLAERQIDLILAHDGEQAWKLYQKTDIDILITDVRMPHMDGLTLIRKIRQTDENLPIIITTVNAETDDLEAGFEAGADDYLRKPFSIRELALRIKALTRRTNRTCSSATLSESHAKGTKKEVLPLGRYILDIPAQQLTFHAQPECKGENDKCRSLSFRETAILEHLIAADGAIVENTRLLNELWGSDDTYNLNSLYVFINRLKHYLSDDSRIQFINVRGVGYRLNVQTDRHNNEEQPAPLSVK